MGLTLDRMNEAGDDVNNKELALTRAKSSAQRIQDDEKKRCQVGARGKALAGVELSDVKMQLFIMRAFLAVHACSGAELRH